MAELGRLKNTGIRVDDDILEQCANHDISYDLGLNVYEETNRERLNADIDQQISRPRFDSTWRAREVDVDSTEGISSKLRSASRPALRSHSLNSGNRRAYRHHDSHENLSTTESSSSSTSDDEMYVTARKDPERHHHREHRSRRTRSARGEKTKSNSRSSSLKPQDEGAPLTMKDLSPSPPKNVYDSLPTPQPLPPSELEQIKKALTGEIEEKKVLSDHIIELRHKVDRQNTASKMAKSAELVLGRVVKQLQKTVQVLNRTAKRRRLNKLFSKCFHSWFLHVARTKRAKAVLKRGEDAAQMRCRISAATNISFCSSQPSSI